ncbi:MAG: heme-binding protein [Gammaproteobacteria bacterium]|nr:heme-binding protein [Gammaproteobacteria bacterium]NIR84023.1 heme-binding protein [Gammaproteobacteria bacterium]NIR89167.1 heme-binding protein [Gammaproteobacteria bacterium]NIU04969.1 heme-binding protein [Gammaproteobacteria bacterium]NIV52135.1 heme-binding protein [Gammaproteobacteria bacterium]
MSPDRPGRRARRAGAVLLSAALLVLVTSPTRAVPSRPVLPLALAQEAAASALRACAEEGYDVSVAVVDGDGLVKVLLRGDGAGPHTLDSSSRKAYTALSLRHSTGALVELVQKNPSAAGLRDMNERILILGGGLPIRVANTVVGGIGVGGAPGGELDEACARAGIDAIRERLR